MANLYVSSVAYAAVAQWAALTSYNLGAYVRGLATPSFGSDRVWKATTVTTVPGVSGISGAAEPNWNRNDGGTTADGTITWTEVGGREAEQVSGNWKAALGTVQAACNISGGTFNNIIVADTHVETVAGSWSNQNGQALLCVKAAAAIPPGPTDDSTGASISTTGNSGLLVGFMPARGITFTCGSGANNISMTIGRNGADGVSENCTFIMGATGAGCVFQLGASNASQATTRLVNATFKFANAGQSLQTIQRSCVEWRGGSIDGTGSIPTNLFTALAGSTMRIVGVDLSAINTNIMRPSTAISGLNDIIDCKLAVGVVKVQSGQGTGANVDQYLALSNCDDATSGKNYQKFVCGLGYQFTTSTLLAASGGASDGVVAYSWAVVMQLSGGSSVTLNSPARLPWISRRYATTGVAKTLTVKAIAFTATIPSNLSMWMEADALDHAGVPLADTVSTRQALPLGAGTACTADTTDWTVGGVAARANSHSYVLGDQIKLASNAGRVFQCTTAGNSASSEPGGFATAVDGGAVVDGTATFTAGWRIKFAVAFTPQLVGTMRARICSAIGANNFAVDPKLYVA